MRQDFFALQQAMLPCMRREMLADRARLSSPIRAAQPLEDLNMTERQRQSTVLPVRERRQERPR